jgi:hypothetical protein
MENAKPKANGQAGSTPGAQVLNDIASLIRRYLVCDDHQLTILSLWAACTQCHYRFGRAPYLDIRSAEPHSGKTLCLYLLCDLTAADICYTGLPATPLIDRLIQGRSLDEFDPSQSKDPSTVLLDDCQQSFGSSERQPIIALLNSGSDTSGFFARGKEDFSLFGPKAFAGNSPLPRSLAARCIPIHLRRPRPSEKFSRYHAADAEDAMKILLVRLREWLKQAAQALANVAKNNPQDLSPALSPGQRKCAEPLVHIADVAGGAWPAKVRAALIAVFDLVEVSPELQLLSDVRAIFHNKNNPEYLATSDLLNELREMENRPWNAWGAKSGRRLAGHLCKFDIGPKPLHYGSPTGFKGYRINDLQDAWDRYLPPFAGSVNSDESASSSEEIGDQCGMNIASASAIAANGAD